MSRSVSHLLRDLADTCESTLDQVIATTPHSTYTFEITGVRWIEGCVVLDLAEIHAPPGRKVKDE
jgi:hypothetical protein